MTKRIFFARYDSAGKFPDGRVKLDVHFKDSQQNMYIWTPDWQKGMRNLFLEAYRIEQLNRPKGPEIEKFKQTGKEVSSGEGEEETESYKEIEGKLRGLEKDRFIIHQVVYEGGQGDFMSFFFDPNRKVKIREWKIPLSVDFDWKIIEETKNRYNWLRRNINRSGKWIIINGKLFDVEWEEQRKS